MKKFIISNVLLFSGMAFSQVIIGDNIGTVPANQKQSVLLEFAKGQNKGIILPSIRPAVPLIGTVEKGTILLDASDVTKAKVKYYNGTWVDLSSGNEADITTQMSVQPLATDVTEVSAAKAVIGASGSTANGVLVLESGTKAMVLPQVNSTDDIVQPAPGMMVYINKTGAKRLAVFNGSKWTYWAP